MGRGAGVEFARHDAGVLAFAPDVADGAGVAPDEAAGFGVDGVIVGGVVGAAVPAGPAGAVVAPITGLGEEPIVSPPPQPATTSATTQTRNELRAEKVRIAWILTKIKRRNGKVRAKTIELSVLRKRVSSREQPLAGQRRFGEWSPERFSRA